MNDLYKCGRKIKTTSSKIQCTGKQTKSVECSINNFLIYLSDPSL